MAEFTPAYEWTTGSEDPLGLHAVVKDPVDQQIIPPDATPEEVAKMEADNARRAAAQAISGINSYWFPADFATVEAVPQSQRGPFVMHFYALHFWNGFLGLLNSQDLANRVYDGGVNSGPGNAAIWLQKALGALGVTGVTVDGHWGPITVAAANSAPQDALLDAFKAERVEFLRANCADNPALDALIARAMK